jgi:hypothetical protein
MAFIAIPSLGLRWLVPDAGLSAAFAMAMLRVDVTEVLAA